MFTVFTVFTVRRVESVCIEEDTLIFEVNLVEDNGMLDDVDTRDRTPRQPPPLPAKTGSIRSIEGRETESAKTSKFTVPNSTFGDKRQSLWLVGEPDVRTNYGMGSRI